MWAVSAGNVTIVKTLTGAGADIRATDVHGRTALHGVVENLVAGGADVNIRRAVDGDTALHQACRHGGVGGSFNPLAKGSG